MTGKETGPRRGDSRGRRHLTAVTNTIPPDVITVAGEKVITSAGRVTDAPEAGPADEMLDRLWVKVGNGLVLLGAEYPPWGYLLTDAREWQVQGGPAWYTVAKNGAMMRVGVLEKIRPENDPLIGPDLISTTMRHKRFGDLTGVPFYADGGTTAGLLLDRTVNVKGATVLRSWADDKAPTVAEVAFLGPWTAAGEYCPGAQLDKNAQFLCAANSALLPLDGLRQSQVAYGAGWEEWVGLWRIRTPANPEPKLPHPMGRPARPGAWCWVAQPTVDLFRELGVTVETSSAWLCPRSRARRAMVPWYERLRDARAAVAGDDDDAHAIRQAVKDTYSRGIGCLEREGRRWYRPDWRAILYAQARVTLYRAMLKAGREEGRWPAETRTDVVVYEGDVPKTYRVGSGMGEWKLCP